MGSGYLTNRLLVYLGSVMEDKNMEQLIKREEKVEESQINGEESEYLNTKEEGRKLSKTELIKQLLITIDVQPPSDTMPTKARKDGDYPAARQSTPFGTPHLQAGTPYLIRDNHKVAS